MRNVLIAGAALTALLSGCGGGESDAERQDALEEANKEKAVYCMDLIFNQHNLTDSRTECFGDSYIQHSSLAEDGLDAAFDFFAEFIAENPELSLDIKRVAAEGDYVWIHHNGKQTPDALGWAVVEIFRLEDGKLAEHWDVYMEVPAEPANDNTMF